MNENSNDRIKRLEKKFSDDRGIIDRKMIIHCLVGDLGNLNLKERQYIADYIDCLKAEL